VESIWIDGDRKVLEGGKGRGKWCNYNIKKSYKNLKEKWL